MASAEYNTIIEQGATFTRTLTLTQSGTVFVLTGYTARMMLKTNKCGGAPIISLTPGNGITITEATGVITLTMTKTQTAGMNFITAYYDLEIESGTAVVTRVLEGVMTLSKEVTRP